MTGILHRHHPDIVQITTRPWQSESLTCDNSPRLVIEQRLATTGYAGARARTSLVRRDQISGENWLCITTFSLFNHLYGPGAYRRRPKMNYTMINDAHEQ